MNSLQYSVYKGKSGKWGALQLNLLPPHFRKGDERAYKITGSLKEMRENGWVEKPGCVFLEATSPSAPDVYDWKNSIKMALSVNDLGKILLFMSTGDELNIFHDPGAQSQSAGQVGKTLKMYTKGLKNGALLTLLQKTKASDEQLEHKVPLTGDELVVLRELFKAAAVRCLAW